MPELLPLMPESVAMRSIRVGLLLLRMQTVKFRERVSMYSSSNTRSIATKMNVICIYIHRFSALFTAGITMVYKYYSY